MDLGLRGMRALVTGAGEGIGLAIAAELVAEGCAVAICGRRQQTLDAALERLGVGSEKAVAHVVDLADAQTIGPWVDVAAAALGGVDIVVHNASGGGGAGDEAWRRNIDVDLLGFARLVEHASPHLQRSEHPSVVAIASTAALESFGNPVAPFGAMKAALIHQAAGLSKTLAAHGIRVNAISPGPVLADGGVWEAVRAQRPEYVDGIISQIPLGRMGTPEDIARLVVFVASPAAGFVTGANIVADGGLTKRIPI